MNFLVTKEFGWCFRVVNMEGVRSLYVVRGGKVLRRRKMSSKVEERLEVGLLVVNNLESIVGYRLIC